MKLERSYRQLVNVFIVGYCPYLAYCYYCLLVSYGPCGYCGCHCYRYFCGYSSLNEVRVLLSILCTISLEILAIRNQVSYVLPKLRVLSPFLCCLVPFFTYFLIRDGFTLLFSLLFYFLIFSLLLRYFSRSYSICSLPTIFFSFLILSFIPFLHYAQM